MKHLTHLNKYFFRYKWMFLLGILFVAVSNIFGVVPAPVIRYAFDLVAENVAFYQLYNHFDLQSEFYRLFGLGLIFFGAIVLLLAVLKGVFMFFMRQTLIVMSRYIEYDMKNEIYEQYQKLDLAFYKKNNTGDLMSRATEDVSRVRMYIGPAIMYSINLIVLFVMVIGTMIHVNAELTFYVLLPLPLLSFSIYYVNNIINKKGEEIQQQLSFLTTVAQEIYSGIRVIKSYVQEIPVLKYFEKETEKYKGKSLELAKVEALFFPLMLFLIGLSTILTVYIGGIEVANGEVTPGNIAEFVIYVNMLTWPVTSIGWVASMIQRAAASQKRINEFLQTESEIQNLTGFKNLSGLAGKIEFRNVSLVYPNTGIEALKNISFTVQSGEKLAIIGRVGSGKSSVAQLLLRMYDVTKGEVIFDGINMKEIMMEDLRKNIGYVPQDVFLFSDTVANNIAFGTDEFSKSSELLESSKEIKQAAKDAAIYNEIAELPESFETVIGERGVTLSGGQKQRISIARALIRNPKILLLDDCLSSVDVNTEKTILSNLNKLLQNKTVIIITHRIFSTMDFDKIIVLDNGKIAEEGKHEQLMSKKGLYFEMYERQKMEEAV